MSQSTGASPVSARERILALVADAALVVLFAAIGNASHGGDLGPAGVASTAWPFLVGLVVGWLVSLAWRAPFAPVRTGLPVWAVTVVGGMLLRVVTGEGAELPFIIVATLTLLVLLVGWRLLSAAVRRGRAGRAATPSR